jgi:hypothetical protein
MRDEAGLFAAGCPGLAAGFAKVGGEAGPRSSFKSAIKSDLV